MSNSSELNCRVCGFEQVEPPWGVDGLTPEFLICECCGTEFGYEDVTVESARHARAAWLAKGTRWFVSEARPLNWALEEQLRNVPTRFV